MQTIIEVLQIIRDFLADDTSISGFCISVWGKKHTVFLGYDRESPPTEEFWPTVVIGDIREISRQGNRAKHTMIIGVLCRGLLEPVEIGNKVTFQGLLDSISLREFIISSIEKNQAKIKAKIEFSGETIPESKFPLFANVISLKIETIIESR